MSASATIKALKAAKHLQQGGLIAHQTATIAGVAASPHAVQGIKKLQLFKQRHAPFLLLADSLATALKQAVYISPALRKLTKPSWPSGVTLVFKARKQLHPACYQGDFVAVRVDADKEVRQLARHCGGLLLSSSFNRKAQAVLPLRRKWRYRLKRHLSYMLRAQHQGSNQASRIFKITGRHVHPLR